MSNLSYKETLLLVKQLVDDTSQKTITVSRSRLSALVALAEKAQEQETNKLIASQYYKKRVRDLEEELKEVRAKMEHYKNKYYRQKGAAVND